LQQGAEGIVSTLQRFFPPPPYPHPEILDSVFGDSADLPDGTGVMTWPDGRKYAGLSRNGKMDGQGKMTYPYGKVEEGFWKDDKFAGAAQ
jgi:hypothetical protein